MHKDLGGMQSKSVIVSFGPCLVLSIKYCNIACHVLIQSADGNIQFEHKMFHLESIFMNLVTYHSIYRLPVPIPDHFWEFSTFNLFCQNIFIRIQ